MELLNSAISNLTNEKIIVIYCYESENRKKIHQYLENEHPTLTNASVRIDKPEFPYKITVKQQCYECEEYVKMDYHYGYEPNNIDEWYSGWCEKCQISVSFEPNFDDAEPPVVIRIHNNNIIVVGHAIQFKKPQHATRIEISNEEINQILSNCKIHVIDVGDKYWRSTSVCGKNRRLLNKQKNNLAKYIEDHIC